MRLAASLLPALFSLAAMAQAPQTPAAASPAPSAIPLKLAWTDVVTKNPDKFVGTFDGDRVYYQNSFHHLVARDGHSGKLIWYVDAPGDPGMITVASRDLLLDLDADSRLHGLATATGKELWTIQLKSVWTAGMALGSLSILHGPMTKPALRDGTIYLGTYGKDRGGSLNAIDAATGKLIWTLKTKGGVENDLIIKDGWIYAGGGSAYYAVEAATGKTRWMADLRMDTQWSTALLDGKLYISSGHYASAGSGGFFGTSTGFSGTLYSLDPDTGKQLWTYDIGGPSPISVGEGVLVGVEWGTFGGSKLVGINAMDGKKLWSLDEKGMTPPLVRDGRVLHQTKDDQIRILDLHSGKELAVIKSAGTFDMSSLHPWDYFCAPFSEGGKTFVGSWGGSKKGSLFQQVDLQTGKVVAETDIPGKLTSRPSVAGGRVAVLTDKPEGSLSVYE